MLAHEEWSSRLRKCCGRYDAEPTQDRSASERFDVEQVHGMPMASIRCTIDRLDRTRKGIRRDDSEHFFLLHQIDGETGVTHNNHEALLKKGDFLILDSTREAELHFGGKTSEFHSVHLPRNLFLAGRKHAPALGRKITSRHPLHASLVNLVSASIDKSELDHFQSDDLFDFIAMAFRPELDPGAMGLLRNQSGRMLYISQVIDQNLGDPEFSLDSLAKRVGRSRRQLQRDFSCAGTTFTELLQTRRLKSFIDAFRMSERGGGRLSIAELSYASGFSDQSHFNRLFRKHYQTSPRDFIRQAE